MKCPYCGAEDQSRVLDTTRDTQDGIRRRRQCKNCKRRFSTYEKVLRATPLLVKSNGDREAFDREKLIRGIQISCAKRPIPASGINALVNRIETHLQQMGRDEVSSRVVGDMVIEGLKELDPIAYIRYAIVYLGLDNLTGVRDMIDNLLGDQNDKPGKRAKTVRSSASRSKPAESSASSTTSSAAGAATPVSSRPTPETSS
ncbi:MAG: transcriptional repressor NrdR [Anaerolineae bacterium]|nr:transcriptional repressor NrdR [Anaerolineae bacterium]